MVKIGGCVVHVRRIDLEQCVADFEHRAHGQVGFGQVQIDVQVVAGQWQTGFVADHRPREVRVDQAHLRSVLGLGVHAPTVALEALLGEGLLERGRLKAFTVRLAEIAKGYIGAVAGVSLLEKTTAECRPLLRAAGFSAELSAWLVGWLGELDMVKFAGDRPAAEVLREKAETLRMVIVDTSRPQPSDDEEGER